MLHSKKCKRCNSLKSHADFYKHKGCLGGLRPECKQCWNKKTASYYTKNKEVISSYKTVWARENYKKEEKRLLIRKYNIDRWHTDVFERLRRTIRAATRRMLKKQKTIKSKRSTELLGCSIEEAKAHIERQFVAGMSWDNHGTWHIDHIKPLASAKTIVDAEKLCHYTNLQPLWAKDNLTKGARYVKA